MKTRIALLIFAAWLPIQGALSYVFPSIQPENTAYMWAVYLLGSIFTLLLYWRASRSHRDGA